MLPRILLPTDQRQKKPVVIADKVFERPCGSPTLPIPPAIGAAVGHLIIEFALRFIEDLIVAAVDRMVLKQKQRSDSSERIAACNECSRSLRDRGDLKG